MTFHENEVRNIHNVNEYSSSSSMFTFVSRKIMKKPERKGEEDEKIVHDHCSRLLAPGGHARRVQGSHAGARSYADGHYDSHSADRVSFPGRDCRAVDDDEDGAHGVADDGSDDGRRHCAVTSFREKPAPFAG